MMSEELYSHGNQDDEQDYELVSKTAIKKEMHELKAIGARLMDLKASLLDKLPLNERLREAIDESKRIKSKNARKRHLGFIGKLMQDQDMAPITELLNSLDASSDEYNRRFHQLEQWRNRLLNESSQAITDYLSEYPQADRQHLRQLVRNAQKEIEQNKAPATSRKLFKYLRMISED